MRALRVVGLTEDGEPSSSRTRFGSSASRCRPTSGCALPRGATCPGSARSRSSWRASCDHERSRPESAPERPWSRSPRQQVCRSRRSSASPTRCCWSASGRRTTPSAPIRCARTARTTARSARSSRTRSGCAARRTTAPKWDSWKGEDGRWVVALSWRAGRSDNHAHWVFQPGAHGGTVTALDEHASDLVEGLPARPLRTVGAVVDMTRPEEEPPPAHSPVEQWRAAASDSFREQRLPMAPDAGRRTPSEPWRPAPSQRQAEPPADPRSGRQDPYRQARVPRGPASGCLPPHRTPRRPAPGRAARGDRPAEPLADPRPARPELLPARGLPARHPFPTPRAGGAARKRGADVRGVGAVGARRHPDRGAARARWRRDGARGPDRSGRAGGGRRDAAPAAPVIPAPSAEKDPVVEPTALEPTAAVAEAPAEAPAAVIADAPAPAEPEEAVAAPELDEAAAAEQAPAEPTPTEPPAPGAAAAEPAAAQRSGRGGPGRAGCGRTIWIRSIREPQHPAGPYGSEPSETRAAAEPSGTEPSAPNRPSAEPSRAEQPPTQTHPRRRPPHRPQLRRRRPTRPRPRRRPPAPRPAAPARASR